LSKTRQFVCQILGDLCHFRRKYERFS
jgi:hypothetical protein